MARRTIDRSANDPEWNRRQSELNKKKQERWLSKPENRARMQEIRGVKGEWKTVKGRHVFIEEGKTLEQALGHKPGVENQKKIDNIKPDYLPGKRTTEELKGMRYNTLTDEEKEQIRSSKKKK